MLDQPTAPSADDVCHLPDPSLSAQRAHRRRTVALAGVRHVTLDDAVEII